MEQVFALESVALLAGHYSLGTNVSSGSQRVRTGVIEKVLRPGHFIIEMGPGFKIEAKGAEFLKVGTRVRLLSREHSPAALRDLSKPSFAENLEKSGIHWWASLPLGFGGKDSLAKLEVFADENQGSFSKNEKPAFYFAFTVVTKNQGEIQWFIHIKNKRLSIQVYENKKMKGTSLALATLIRDLESSLKSRGFHILSPTVLLTRPIGRFSGVRLNLQG